MPRSNLVKDPVKEKNMMITEKISGRMSSYGLTRKDMGKALNIHPDTFGRKRSHPERFTLEELRTVYRILDIPEDDEARTKII